MNYDEIMIWVEEFAPPDVAELIKRLERGEGSGALTGFPAAKRAGEPGRAEDREQRDRPQSLAVSAAKSAVAGGWRSAAVVLPHLLTKPNEPESESSENAGDGKLPTDSIEAGNDSNNGTASGRRNVPVVAPPPQDPDSK